MVSWIGTFVKSDSTSMEAKFPLAVLTLKIWRKSTVEFSWHLAASYGVIIYLGFDRVVWMFLMY